LSRKWTLECASRCYFQYCLLLPESFLRWQACSRRKLLRLALTFLFTEPTLVVGHIHLLGIGALVCLLYAGLYYVSVRVLHLTLSVPLSLVHFAITLLALVGLGNLRYLGLGHERPTVDNPLIGLLAINAITLMLVGSFLFFAIILLASMIKLRQKA
jgi:hypothetical protein